MSALGHKRRHAPQKPMSAANGRIIGQRVRHVHFTARTVRGLTSTTGLSRMYGVKVPQQLYLTADSTLLQCSPTIWAPTEGLRLVASCGPQGGTPAPRLSRRHQTTGSQRVPLLTGHETLVAGRCCHKRRLETV